MKKNTETSAPANADRRNAVDAIRDKVLNLLEEGNLPPWAKPWNSALQAPRSFSTGSAYRGWNMVYFLFEMLERGYEHPFFISQGDAKRLGINVDYRSDAWLWGMYYGSRTTTKRNEQTGEEEENTYFFPKAFKVIPYDAVPEDQRPELPFDYVSPFGKDFTPDEAAQELVDAYFNKEINPLAPSLTYGGNRAYYVPKDHAIRMPNEKRFDGNTAGYYKTFFHEMIHSTGHNSILVRFGTKNEKSHASDHLYSFEELVAEMGAMMLIAHLGLSFEDTTVNSAAYIAGWAKSLKDPNHKDWITKAATQAAKAVDKILELVGLNTSVYEERTWENFKDETDKDNIVEGPFSIAKATKKADKPVKKGRQKKSAA